MTTFDTPEDRRAAAGPRGVRAGWLFPAFYRNRVGKPRWGQARLLRSKRRVSAAGDGSVGSGPAYHDGPEALKRAARQDDDWRVLLHRSRTRAALHAHS